MSRLEPVRALLVAALFVAALAVACGASVEAPRRSSEPRRADPPPRASTVTAVAAGPTLALATARTCAIAGGRVHCFGNGEPPVHLHGARSVVAGYSHFCALTADGAALCWGSNERGQLGDGTELDREAPVRVRTDARFAALAAGEQHTCGLRDDGRVMCWGRNDGGQLGDGTRTDRSEPVLVAGLVDARLLAAGGQRSCAVRGHHAIACWGVPPDARDDFRRGSTSPTELRAPLALERIAALDLGDVHGCFLSESGAVRCFGEGPFDQLGAEPFAKVRHLSRVTAISAGRRSSCAVTIEGEVRCWGRIWDPPADFSDDLAVALPTAREPVRIGALAGAVEVEVADAHACARLADGSVWCWGANANGRIGPRAGEASARPVRLPIGE